MTLPAVADTALLENLPDFNLGGQSDLPAGTLGSNAGGARTRVLIRFDLAAHLPPAARIQSALLRWTVTRQPDGAAPALFGLYRMLRPWSEGDKSGPLPGGDVAQAGESSWLNSGDPDTPWGDPGAQAGTDFVAQSTATEAIGNTGEVLMELGAAGVADLELWRSDPATNHGWMLRSVEEQTLRSARRFASREATSGVPELRVRYQVEVPAPRFLAVTIDADQVLLRFQGSAGLGYVCETTPSLLPTSWSPIQTVPPLVASGEVTLTNPLPFPAQAWFRLRVAADDD